MSTTKTELIAFATILGRLQVPSIVCDQFDSVHVFGEEIFYNWFPELTVTDRWCHEWPFELSVMVGNIKVFCLAKENPTIKSTQEPSNV